MNNEILYKRNLLTEYGKPYEKIYLNYQPGKIMLCDCCNEKKPCASLMMLCGDAAIICIDCLTKIIEEFNIKEK